MLFMVAIYGLDVLHFRMEGDAVFGFYGLDYFGFQAYDFFRGGFTAGVDYYQRLVPVHLRAEVQGRQFGGTGGQTERTRPCQILFVFYCNNKYICK